MSEQEIREGMLLAVWDEPPLDFDPDALIRRVEQKKSRRRALVTVGVATAMIVVASFALPGLLPRDRDSQLGADDQPSSSAPPSEGAEKRAERIGQELMERLALADPNLREVYANLRNGKFSNDVYPSSTPPRRPADPELSGYVYLTDPIGPTALRVEGIKGEFSLQNFCSGAVTCQDVRQKDGTVVSEAEFTDGGPDISRAEVVRKFESGYYVRIASYNYNPATGSGLRQTVPVRVPVLTRLITDPAVRWE